MNCHSHKLFAFLRYLPVERSASVALQPNSLRPPPLLLQAGCQVLHGPTSDILLPLRRNAPHQNREAASGIQIIAAGFHRASANVPVS